MKRTLALAICGLGVVAVNTAMAQGHVSIWGYGVAPYNQVVWDAGVPGVGGQAVNDTAVQLSFWVGAGVVTDPGALVQSTSAAFVVNPGITYVGPSGTAGGYYDPQVLKTPGIGEFTFQIRAGGNAGPGEVIGSSALFQVTSVADTLPAPQAPLSPEVNVGLIPEPTTFALAGLGAAALLIFRRRD